ncbi:response regulator [Polaribacter sp.]|uniref:response regulator n=1 Tax=Polaribacter sp. TaxID=1920175 RepID=UPI003F6B4EAD
MSKKEIKVLLVEDHDSVSLGVKYSLIKQKEINFDITIATTADMALNYTNREVFDVVLLDLILKNESKNSKLSSGDDLLRELNKWDHRPKIIMLSKIDSLEMLDYVINLLNADGYIIKSRTSLQELIPAIKAVLSGESFFSDSIKKILRYNESLLDIDFEDRTILKLLSSGYKQAEIAKEFMKKDISMTVSAIEKRIKKLKLRFEAQTTAQLTALAIKGGII